MCEKLPLSGKKYIREREYYRVYPSLRLKVDLYRVIHEISRASWYLRKHNGGLSVNRRAATKLDNMGFTRGIKSQSEIYRQHFPSTRESLPRRRTRFSLCVHVGSMKNIVFGLTKYKNDVSLGFSIGNEPRVCIARIARATSVFKALRNFIIPWCATCQCNPKHLAAS